MKKQFSPSFCALPWFHLMANNQGRISPCCIAEPLTGAFLPGSSTDVEGVRNSEQMEQLRKQMLLGERPSPCMVCFDAEDRGLRSARIEANDRFSRDSHALFCDSRVESYQAGSLLSADIRIENICNLKCRMCGPESSKPLYQEWEQLGLKWEKEFPLFTWETDEEWVQFFRTNPDLEYLTLAGGEPFITPRVIWIIDFLISERRASRMNICFHTNLTRFSSEFVGKLAEFRTAKILVSIEGAAQINSYIRFQSSWERLEANFLKLNEFSRFPFVKASFGVTVQAYNILYLVEFLEYAARFSNFDPPSLNILTAPRELQLGVLPRKFRIAAAEKLLRFMPQVDFLYRESDPADVSVFKNQLKDLVFRLQGFEQEKYLHEFVSRTVAMDTFRNQNILDFLPELEELFAKGTSAVEGQ